MAVSLESLGIDRMSLDDKIELVHAIWDQISLEAEHVPITDSQRFDLERRLREHRQNPTVGSSWEEVKIRLV
ncbi:addiction module protein [Zavarzinella formosa]|uniref:addiction module protein n=1 Tax=Zavarzinella formosa TaxID=360055 RepID=UPI00031654F4|nr:addiction module protein [Zavarzinella formosa]